MPGATTIPDSPPSPASSNVSGLGLVADAVTLGAPESRVLVIATGMYRDVPFQRNNVEMRGYTPG